jgi:hypothetical protein
MLRSPRVPRLVTVPLALLLVVSCDNPMCGCPPSRDAALVYGRVTDASGNPAVGIRVEARHDAAGCVEPGEVIGNAFSQAGGAYRMPIYTVSPARPGDCLRAYALASTNTVLVRGSDTVAFAVRFAVDVAEDSVRVDLVLRAP